MPVLQVRKFSCIDQAKFSATPLTVIIGPQGSGKSVLCKLAFFFDHILRQTASWIGDPDSSTVDAVFDHYERKFVEWFPPAAWGKSPFQIEYSAGAIQFEVKRLKTRNGAHRAKFVRSKALVRLIEDGIRVANLVREKYRKGPLGRYEGLYGATGAVHSLVQRTLGADDLTQVYIPAGRSFFTSVGKIVTALDGNSMLDPVVSMFGQTIARLRDRSYMMPEHLRELMAPFQEIIGGRIVSEVGGKEYVATSDGRRVPVSSLSSGQQELLPLYFALASLIGGRGRLAYLEEPEAHLFPDAQASMVQILVQMINKFGAPSQRRKDKSVDLVGLRTLVVTTHSPYVLSKLNNLVKAGQLGQSRSTKRKAQLADIVPQDAWIKPAELSAYAIKDRKLVSILDEEGLIDGSYIDHVSEVTGEQFDQLLDLEHS